MAQQMYRVIDHDKDLEFEKQKIPKDPEEKIYLLCIAFKDNQNDTTDSYWNLVKGRTNARDEIKDMIDYIDFETSFILVESCTLNERKSIYAFMKHIESLYNDGFDIDEYIKGDWSEEDYIKHNEIDTSIYNKDVMNRGVSMQDMMNGNVDIKSI